MKLLKSGCKAVIRAALSLLIPLWVVLILFICLFLKLKLLFTRKKRSPRLLWGIDSLINNRYWANAMKKNGYQAVSFVHDQSTIVCKSKEYDRTVESTVPFYTFWKNPVIYKYLGRHVLGVWSPYFAFMYMTFHFDIFHLSFNGGPLSETIFSFLEPFLFQFCGKKTVITPYGGDAYCFSEIKDPSIQHGLLMSTAYENSKKTKQIQRKIYFWSKHADVIISGGAIDGLPRWDVLAQNHLVIDLDIWKPKEEYSKADGKNGIVSIVHTPNHRGFKGTEFIIQAVQELKDQDLQIKLILLEGVENSEVRKVMQEEADILAEQFIFSGYALSGIEGMASGLAVMGNLETEIYSTLFRRFSYLNECPIFSTPVESIKENLKFLVTHPKTREILGRAGRKYVEKYHSPKAAEYLFGSIYKKIWNNEKINLLTLYHPLLSEYSKQTPAHQNNFKNWAFSGVNSCIASGNDVEKKVR